MFEFLYTFLPGFFTSPSPVDLGKRFPEVEPKEDDVLTVVSIHSDEEEIKDEETNQEQIFRQTQIQEDSVPLNEILSIPASPLPIHIEMQTVSLPLISTPKISTGTNTLHYHVGRRSLRRERIRQTLQEMRSRPKEIARSHLPKINRINQPRPKITQTTKTKDHSNHQNHQNHQSTNNQYLK